MRKVFAVILLGLAGLLAVIELFALLDPAGTKMADDADPFGPPAPWDQHAFYIVVIIAFVLLAWRLMRWSSESEHSKQEKTGI